MIKEIQDLNIINKYLKEFSTSIDEIDCFSKFLIYDIEGKDVALLHYSLIYDRIEINYIFVDKEYRKQNIGSKLINKMNEDNKDINNITLEVRSSNKTAISFYEKLGFKKVAVRDNYYNGEDGILMLKEVTK